MTIEKIINYLNHVMNEFILSRIKKIKKLEYNLIYFDRKNKQIIDLRNENNSI